MLARKEGGTRQHPEVIVEISCLPFIGISTGCITGLFGLLFTLLPHLPHVYTMLLRYDIRVGSFATVRFVK